MKSLSLAPLRSSLAHTVRTTIAAVLAVVVARAAGLPEVVWAPISTFIVMQSTLGTALKVSWQRLAGTALGCGVGALLVASFGESLVAFGVAVFVLGLMCAALSLDRAAYRFAGITLTVIMLVANAEPVWTVSVHRFIEVALGIAVGVVVTAAWPAKGIEKDKPVAKRP